MKTSSVYLTARPAWAYKIVPIREGQSYRKQYFAITFCISGICTEKVRDDLISVPQHRSDRGDIKW